MGRLEEAIADFSHAIELDPKNASSYNSRGLARDRALLRDAALEDFTAAISMDGGSNPLYWHNRGFCYRNMGRFQEAISDYSRAIELDGSNAAAFNNRGYAWRKLGWYAEAASDYTRSLELDPSNVKAYNNRGYCHAKAGKYLEAVADYSRVIALDPLNAHAYHNRGISYDKVRHLLLPVSARGVCLNARAPASGAPPPHTHTRPLASPPTRSQCIRRPSRTLPRCWSWTAATPTPTLTAPPPLTARAQWRWP